MGAEPAVLHRNIPVDKRPQFFTVKAVPQAPGAFQGIGRLRVHKMVALGKRPGKLSLPEIKNPVRFLTDHPVAALSGFFNQGSLAGGQNQLAGILKCRPGCFGVFNHFTGEKFISGPENKIG